MTCVNCKRNFDGGCPYTFRKRPDDCKYFEELK